MMKIQFAALLVLVFFVGGVTTACMADASAQLASPHAVATPLGPDLVGEGERIYWVYESEVELGPEDMPFISFGTDGFGGQAQCGDYGASYTYAPDGKIEIGVVIQQGPGCSEELVMYNDPQKLDHRLRYNTQCLWRFRSDKTTTTV